MCATRRRLWRISISFASLSPSSDFRTYSSSFSFERGFGKELLSETYEENRTRFLRSRKRLSSAILPPRFYMICAERKNFDPFPLPRRKKARPLSSRQTRGDTLSPSRLKKLAAYRCGHAGQQRPRDKKRTGQAPFPPVYSAVFLFFLAVGELIFQLDELLYLVEEGVDVLELAVHRGVTHICHVVHFAELFHDQFAYVF